MGEFFGLTFHGVDEIFKHLMRYDYREPLQPSKEEIIANPEFEIYIGPYNGYPYSSCDRFRKLKKKGITKPEGPHDIYKFPGALASMEIGLFMGDAFLKNETWYENDKSKRLVCSEMSKFVETMLLKDKNARIFCQ